MSACLNPGNGRFEKIKHEYKDKSNLLKFTNGKINRERAFVCVCHPRRFGKSVAANMIVAYYGRGVDSHELFRDLSIAEDSSYEDHINKYDVIFINMKDFIKDRKSVSECLDALEKVITNDLKTYMPNMKFVNDEIPFMLQQIYESTRIPFVFVIDEWDCPFREKKDDTGGQKEYVDFLCRLLKGKDYVALAYMTGILPIKKYGTGSELNMFCEYTMMDMSPIQDCFGFTEGDVMELCGQSGRSFEEMRDWYDGYSLEGVSIYNPNSVMRSLESGKIGSYWSKTESFEDLKYYIMLNINGIKDQVLKLIAGEKIPVNTEKFVNDITSFGSSDDVLTLLVHLGYLTYDSSDGMAWIPNNEVRGQFCDTIENVSGWENVIAAIKKSEDLLNATWENREEEVAKGIEDAHSSVAPIFKLNDENSLVCTVEIAYYAAMKYYKFRRESTTGEGFADMLLDPHPGINVPPIIIEFKYGKSAAEAIGQITLKKYTDFFSDHKGDVILVGINYKKNKNNKNKRVYDCIIEKRPISKILGM